jgi:hypothetical protein
MATLEIAATQELLRTGASPLMTLLLGLHTTAQSAEIVQASNMSLLPTDVVAFLQERARSKNEGSSGPEDLDFTRAIWEDSEGRKLPKIASNKIGRSSRASEKSKKRPMN